MTGVTTDTIDRNDRPVRCMRVRHHRQRGSVITDDACYGVLGGDKKARPHPLISATADTTDRYGLVITVGGVGGDQSYRHSKICFKCHNGAMTTVRNSKF